MLKRVVFDFAREFWTPVTAYIWAISTVVVSVAGPFGTYGGLALPARSLFWGGLIAVSLVTSTALTVIARHALASYPEAVRDTFVITAFTLIYTPIVVWTILVVTDAVAPGEVKVVTVGLAVLVITTAICKLLHLLRARFPGMALPGDPRHATQPAPPVEVRLLRRLEGVSAPDILRLTVSDHYVVVHLADGSERRILMRFGDAVIEMEGVPGYGVHRSHWVAATAIRQVISCGGRDMVELNDGTTVPVSRTGRQTLIEAGLIPAAEAPAKAQARPDARSAELQTPGE